MQISWDFTIKATSVEQAGEIKDYIFGKRNITADHDSTFPNIINVSPMRGNEFTENDVKFLANKLSIGPDQYFIPRMKKEVHAVFDPK